MKKVRMLRVEWNENESCTYYVDKNKYSVAHYNAKENIITVESYSGTYTFNLILGTVTLYDGVRVRDVKVKLFKTYLTPSI